MHLLHYIVDIFEFEFIRDQFVELHILGHRHLDKFRDIGDALGHAEIMAKDGYLMPGQQLKLQIRRLIMRRDPCYYKLAGHSQTPKSLNDRARIADHFKCGIHSTIGQFLDDRNRILILIADEMCCAEFLCEVFLALLPDPPQ